jgi:hypothetical protein
MDKKNIKSMMQDMLNSEIPPSQIQLWPVVKAGLNRGENMAMSHPHRLQRVAFAILVVIILLAAALITPQGRAFAQEIIRRVGNYVISGEPSDAENYVATLQSGTPTATIDPNWVCTNCPEPEIVGKLTIEQASAKAGFPVYDPNYIPDGYQLSTRDVLFTGSSTTAHMDFRKDLDPPLHDGLQMAGIIAIGQTLVNGDAQPWEKGIGEVPIVDVNVRGHPGVWLEQVPIIPVQDQQGEWYYERWNQLVWAEDGYNFMLQTNMPSNILPLDELLRIAESLTP